MKPARIRLVLAWVIILFTLAAVYTLGLFMHGGSLSALIVTGVVFAGITALLLLADSAFRLVFRLRIGVPFTPERHLAYEDLYVEPHANLSWIYKSNTEVQNSSKLSYPLRPNHFEAGSYITSGLGFIDGPTGSRDVPLEKGSGEVRIACLGASTTGNYLTVGDETYSYPSQLERILVSRGFTNTTVLNCGVGGYNSADLLVRLALHVIDLHPDYLIVYHAYNDIRAYLTPGFRSDYSHARRGLGEANWRIFTAEAVPTFGFAFAKYLKTRFLSGNIRNSLGPLTWRGTVDLTVDPTEGLSTYRRNLQTIVDIATSRGIKVVLGTFVFYLYEEIYDNPLHLRYRDIVNLENEVVREIARINRLPLVDNAQTFPRDRELFVDSIHFSPQGMTLLATNFADALQTEF